MGNSDLGATGTDFTKIYIDYSKFERFSNVIDEVSVKLLSSFLEYEVLVVVTDRYDFEFSIKAAIIYRKSKLWINKTSTKSFQSYLGNLKNKNNLVKSW